MTLPQMSRASQLLCTFVLACAGLASTSTAAEPASITVAQVVNSQVAMAESETVSLAEAMPADAYNFAPMNGEFKGARTFALEVKHIAATNYSVAAVLLGEKNPGPAGGDNGPDAMVEKDAIVKYLKDSFAYAHRAMNTVNKDNITEQIPSPFGQGKMTRLSAANIIAWHTMDHYGQMAVYARMKNVVPPASRR